ncbi:MAG TPA: hypothetical protein VMM56_13855 [Planctomycetaceae bacterium]|nr:hypothetical protein [Planctomycetaceae bacterium]
MSLMGTRGRSGEIPTPCFDVGCTDDIRIALPLDLLSAEDAVAADDDPSVRPGLSRFDHDPLFDLPQQQPVPDESDPSSIKGRRDFPTFVLEKQQPLRGTLCLRETSVRFV